MRSGSDAEVLSLLVDNLFDLSSRRPPCGVGDSLALGL
jgi:hypothetical protein